MAPPPETTETPAMPKLIAVPKESLPLTKRPTPVKSYPETPPGASTSDTPRPKSILVPKPPSMPPPPEAIARAIASGHTMPGSVARAVAMGNLPQPKVSFCGPAS